MSLAISQKIAKGWAASLLAACLTGFASTATVAAEAEAMVSPGSGRLAAALSAAPTGATLRLATGLHDGPLLIDRPMTLIGEPGAIIRGNGSGSVVTVAAPDITLQGLTITGSGLKLETEDSGIFVAPEGDRARILENKLEANLIGVYLKGPEDAEVRGNEIVGRSDLRVNERGNGVQLWNTPGSIVAQNHIRLGRDGIFVTTSKENIFRDNTFEELRFAIHYMYTNRSEVSGNLSRGNHIGFALMFSNRLTVRGNVSDGDRDHGLLLNYANGSLIEGNVVRGGAEKCVFIYNANKNRIRGNRFESCEIGVHFTAGSERNEIAGNAFVSSRTQVKYVGSRSVLWSAEGRGNYWSDNAAFDLDGNGIADRPYRPNDMVDQVVWRHPLAKLLLNSPALHVLRWSQSAFPALRPGGVIDEAPLMTPPLAAGGAG